MSAQGVPGLDIACFTAGTRIRTKRGAVPVERLREGDLIARLDGSMAPMVWLGKRTIRSATHLNPDEVTPIRVRVGAFGREMPSRDLLLSPEHAVYVDGVLVPVRMLVDDEKILRERIDFLRYFHVLLERHAVIFAEDMPVESYLDTGRNGGFDNWQDVPLRTVFAEPCMPYVTPGPLLDGILAMMREMSATA
jgi:hypothetical protein